MNNNFLGKPTKEDIQTLDQLRRQLVPMTGLLEKLQNDMFLKVSRGEVAEWPHIRHTISHINSYLVSINGYINGSYRHTSEDVKDSTGKHVLDADKNQVQVHRDYVNEPHKDRLAALHAYPQAPYPITHEIFGSMAGLLLSKKLDPPEEKWVEERLRKAAEFAYVPGEWGIEARKPVSEPNKEEESDDEDVDIKGWDEGLPTKRVKGVLTEDQIMEMWDVGHKTAFDKDFQNQLQADLAADEAEDDEAGEDEQGEGEQSDQNMEDDEEEEFVDVETPKGPPAAPVVMIQRAPPSVHKPVPGVPIVSLGFVHRFMASGEVQQR